MEGFVLENNFIDTHAHLSSSFYKENLKDIIKSSLNNLSYIINIGIDEKNIDEVIKISKEYKNIFAVIGYHPIDIDQFNKNSRKKLINYLKNKEVIAIGEIGLDYFHKSIDKEIQKKGFINQIEIAREYDLPIIIHARDSLDDLYQIIKEYPEQKFLLHSWNKEEKEIIKFLDMKNIWFGFNGIITFNSAKNLIPLLKKIPLNRIMFETDAPFLTPIPYRGKKNLPEYVKYVYIYFAKIRNIGLEELENIVIKNVSTFFNLKLND